ncbi:MAG: S9 family peptidase [Bacteroidetes bacterium]|nr:S9 family peptidase [Bacteroidota bacterium]
MKKQLLFISAFLLLGTATISAQEKMTPESMWKLARVSDPRISPDGKTIVYGVKNFDIEANKGNSDLFTISPAGGTPMLIAGGTDNDFNARWRPDGKKIAYLTSKSGSTQIWVMDPDGNNKQQFTDIKGDISGFGFSPTGNKIWFTMDVKTGKTTAEQFPDLPKATGRIYDDLMYRHWDNWEDEMNSHVFYASYTDGSTIKEGTDIMKGEPFDAPLMPFGDEEQIAWNNDGTQIAYTCKKNNGTAYAMSTNSDIYLYNLATGKTENLSTDNPGYDTKPSFSPDGKKIIWLSMATPLYEADRNRIMQYDFTSKVKTELTKGFDYTAESPSWSKDGRYIFFTAGINATDQLWVFDSFLKGAQQIRQVTKDMADLTSYSIAYPGKEPIIVSCAMNISMPSEIFKVDMKTGISKQLTYTNKDQLAKIKMGKVEQRMVKATDGKDILTWVIYPPDFDPTKKYPALLYCQGGPQSTVSQFFSYRWNFQLMAAQGYIVVAPNRRGLPSFGEKWNRDISGDWGGQAMKDLLSAIDDVSKEPFVNKDKLGAVGASFGGYSVYWLAGNHNKRFKTFISHCGVFNLESMYGTTEEIFFANFDMQGSYFDKPTPKSYIEFNPIKFVNNWDTPILVIHNDKDFRVPISQGMEAFAAARLKNIPARFLSFPDENHWVLKPQNGIMWQRVYFDWLDKYLK